MLEVVHTSPGHSRDPLATHSIPAGAVLSPKTADTVRPHIPPYSTDGNDCVWHWKDKQTDAEGWIVIDAPEPTLSGGGLFLHTNASLKEVRDVARTMSEKLAVSAQPQVVGAKGGIRFNQSDQRAAGVLERFIQDNAAVISRYWGTGGDLNTSHEIIDQCCRKHCVQGTATALDALQTALGSKNSLNTDVDGLIQEPIPEIGWPLRDFSVGFVMATTLQQLLKRTNPSLLGHARLTLQGFGCVGATFAQAVRTLGIGKIVGISSQHGFLVDDCGIDCEKIHDLRKSSQSAKVASKFDYNCLEAGLTQDELLSGAYHCRRSGSTDEQHLTDFLSAVKANVFVPCAQRYVLTPNVLQTLVKETFATVPQDSRFILAGANNIFNPKEDTAFYLSFLDSMSIRMLPEWISNSGTSNLFMRACSGLSLNGHALSSLEACAKDTNSFIHSTFRVLEGQNTTSSLWKAAEAVAKSRRQDGPHNLLGIERLSHLTLITSDVQRSTRLFEDICGAIPSTSRNHCLSLPGSSDPTISIIADTVDIGLDRGLTMHFSVSNLRRAQEILERESITHAIHAKCVQMNNEAGILVGRDEVGYPIMLHQTEKATWPPFSSLGHIGGRNSIVGMVRQIDHYAPIMPKAEPCVMFHERFMGFQSIRNFLLNVGSVSEGEKDTLLEVLGLPYDERRTVVLTEALATQCTFSKMLARRGHPFTHHLAFEVDDLERAFTAVRGAGWSTTADHITTDPSSGLRQFFLREEEAGCGIELIQRQTGNASTINQSGKKPTEQADGQGLFRESNIITLTKGLDACL